MNIYIEYRKIFFPWIETINFEVHHRCFQQGPICLEDNEQ